MPKRKRSLPKPAVEEVKPVPMRLVCERCGELHIDVGEFATKPHHTHSCQHCGLTWRPAIIHTVGVRFLPGFRNGA
jgi:transcription elongation factor Elf1